MILKFVLGIIVSWHWLKFKKKTNKLKYP